MYFYLLETNNLCKWANTFNRNNSKVLADLGISSLKTLSAARNRLKQVGLIDFKTKNGSPVVTYTLVKFTEVKAQVDTEVRAQVKAQVDTELNKTKTKTNPNGLFAPAPAREEKPKRKKAEQVIPTLEQVKAYFEGKMPDWGLFRGKDARLGKAGRDIFLPLRQLRVEKHQRGKGRALG